MKLNLEVEVPQKEFRKSMNVTIKPSIIKEFDKICKAKKWSKSSIIELMMKELVEKEQNILTSSF